MSQKRILVVGDIHSGLKALKQVLGKAEVTPDDKLIFLGDYVDGWSTAVETIDFLIALQKPTIAFLLEEIMTSYAIIG